MCSCDKCVTDESNEVIVVYELDDDCESNEAIVSDETVEVIVNCDVSNLLDVSENETDELTSNTGCQFSFTDQSMNDENGSNSSTAIINNDIRHDFVENISTQSDVTPVKKLGKPRFVGDVRSHHLQTSGSVKYCFELARQALRSKAKALRLAQIRNKYLTRKVKKLQDLLIRHLQDKHLTEGLPSA